MPFALVLKARLQVDGVLRLDLLLALPESLVEVVFLLDETSELIQGKGCSQHHCPIPGY